jgi:hypothetical protein
MIFVSIWHDIVIVLLVFFTNTVFVSGPYQCFWKKGNFIGS